MTLGDIFIYVHSYSSYNIYSGYNSYNRNITIISIDYTATLISPS